MIKIITNYEVEKKIEKIVTRYYFLGILFLKKERPVRLSQFV